MGANLVTIASGDTLNLVLTDEQKQSPNLKIRLLCDTRTDVVEINLPKISTLGSSIDFEIYVDDIADNAETKNITITPDVADKINNAASFTITKDGRKLRIVVANRNEWAAITI